MPQAVSLHIGLNSVDPGSYEGWSGPLIACEADAHAMAKICQSRGFATRKLLTQDATRAAVLAWLGDTARTLDAGDIAVVSFSGHGGQIPDLNGDEDDGLDETWCLFDGQMLDDELYAVWADFQAGVRIVLVSDSCHSGTVAKNLELIGRSSLALTGLAPPVPAGVRVAPAEVQRATYEAHQAFYDDLLGRAPAADPVCSVIQISGCQDNQLSMDGAYNGAFTGALLRVWANGTFEGTYERLTKAVRAKLPVTQSPNYFVVGAPNLAFETEAAFSTFALAARAANTTLTIKVENVDGVTWYDFQFDGRPVDVDPNTGIGTFPMAQGTERYLYWHMFGTPGGTMKVTVLAGDEVIATRVRSTIPHSTAAGVDRLRLKL